LTSAAVLLEQPANVITTIIEITRRTATPRVEHFSGGTLFQPDYVHHTLGSNGDEFSSQGG
jgi:hypothetical protein